ncbi:MAG: trigger factor [Zetaproteobacteria bacterium CG_4_9_14_3_um_filter_49_83]|nr:MAG: trigger factor [Zetaproteobacteria bacterium CG1_02_49_23]PIQ31280.1 MAG: trigger factor [Zetaproteobacteria bacterium CG17_big_fil_post_rev_8_21_14_2_50_50_13]PIV29835.1 MAG: trigger factor [Zetaproteobacteria bacterium CG02_land_8_20_14_3_00_50_9]PIY55598.1 MAG: trigger factor [Zetaproteobacteria bacterium CG_4_10_14_0_8_um_filter_49_80]PJA35490.1 MAG: trigger factor [Zetaproteobacteria bacterium CG_4_9_14_3_um_filter_49_83]
MIQTQVKQTGSNEHQVEVKLPKSEYDRIYNEQLAALSRSAKLPGFRPGKTPMQVIKQQFGPKLHDDTVSQLLQTHYIGAIDASGLKPAIQPELDIPAIQPVEHFVFNLNVVTWPEVELSPLAKLEFEQTTVNVENSDIDSVVERLMDSQVKYEEEDGRVAELGDQVTIDFVGFIGDEAFEGGRGEDTPLVLGAGQFIPGFEDQLVGAKAGDHVTVNVTFPSPYQAAHLAGKDARFETDVKLVAKAVKPENEDKLAELLGFENAISLRQDARERLGLEAKDASASVTRDAAFDALLAANDVTISERMIEQDSRAMISRVMQNMQRQGADVGPEMFADEAFQKEVREKSERGLKLSVLIQAVRTLSGVEVSEEEIDAELARVSVQYPAEQRGQFIQWVKSDKEQIANVKERLLEAKCIDHVVAEAKTSKVEITLSQWQKERDNS